MDALSRARCHVIACMTGPDHRAFVSQTGVVPRRMRKITRGSVVATPVPFPMFPARLLHCHS
ncbi:hypothetical protein D5R55_24270 [Burkholderia cenocepacia]|uniref:Uncharacterized protein n=1 Tax=Burkholderia cenocepacia TaxID=95486 RepID=A0A3Q9FC44_9BURK|nr:hypothetical protein D5R55_24270 [Burkholderia cenocepacia]